MNKETIKLVNKELSSARRKFKTNSYLLYAFMEEAGEVVKAFMDMKQKGGTPEEVRAELVQAIAMGVRLLEEGDPEFGMYIGLTQEDDVPF